MMVRDSGRRPPWRGGRLWRWELSMTMVGFGFGVCGGSWVHRHGPRLDHFVVRALDYTS
jgi:hypothetical protein